MQSSSWSAFDFQTLPSRDIHVPKTHKSLHIAPPQLLQSATKWWNKKHYKHHAILKENNTQSLLFQKLLINPFVVPHKIFLEYCCMRSNTRGNIWYKKNHTRTLKKWEHFYLSSKIFFYYFLYHVSLFFLCISGIIIGN